MVETIFCVIVVLAVLVLFVLLLLDQKHKPKWYEEEEYLEHQRNIDSIDEAIRMDDNGTPTMSEVDILQAIEDSMKGTKYGCLSRDQHRYLIKSTIGMYRSIYKAEYGDDK